jgi:hypothetical protein
VQLDEKWSFVHTKEKHCDPANPADARRGDNWDHVAVDAEHRLVLVTVPGKRLAEHVQEAVDDVKRRMGGRVPRLITADEYAPYKQAILNAYGTPVVPARTGKPGRPATKARLVPPPELNFATVHKTRSKGRVIDVTLVIVFGVASAIAAALGRFTVNTSRVERQNGTDRNRNARKVRKTCCFSKDWDVHEAVGYFTLYSYNFCWPVRTLRVRGPGGRWGDPRTPAMSAGLTDHVWTLAEWLSWPAVRRAT